MFPGTHDDPEIMRAPVVAKPKCDSIRGHKFEPRYDEEPIGPFHVKGCDLQDLADLMSAFTKRTYVRDVCTRCGQTIERLTRA